MVFNSLVFYCLQCLSGSGAAGFQHWTGDDTGSMASPVDFDPFGRVAVFDTLADSSRCISCGFPDDPVDGIVLFLWARLSDTAQKMGEDQFFALPADYLACPGHPVLYLGDAPAVYVQRRCPGIECGIAW